MQNGLYFFEIPRICCALIAAPNWKAARNYAIKLSSFSAVMTKLPQVSGIRIRKKCTDAFGEVSLDEIMNNHWAWWVCGGHNCDSESFMSINGGIGYRCLSCGYEGSIVMPENRRII